MGCVHYHRIAGLTHLWQRAHVSHKRVVAKRCATFCQKDTCVSSRFHLSHDIRHIPGGQKLSLLDVYCRARFGSCKNQVRLTTQKRWNLQNICDARYDAALLRPMHVGQHRHANCIFDALQHLQTVFHARSTHARNRSSVCFVIGRFENILRTDAVAGFFHLARNHLRVIGTFQLARPCDDRQRGRVADTQVSDIESFHIRKIPVHEGSTL